MNRSNPQITQIRQNGRYSMATTINQMSVKVPAATAALSR